PHPRYTLFPYTTLFRSIQGGRDDEITTLAGDCGRSYQVIKRAAREGPCRFRPDFGRERPRLFTVVREDVDARIEVVSELHLKPSDRKSTRLNSSHVSIS